MSFFSKMKALWRSLVFILFSNISFYEISHRVHRASCWCFRCFRCNWFDIDWRNCSSSDMSNRSSMRWITNTRIQCDDSSIWDRSSVFPVGVASRVSKGKHLWSLYQSEQVSRSKIHWFWCVESPLTKRAKGIYLKIKDTCFSLSSWEENSISSLFPHMRKQFLFTFADYSAKSLITLWIIYFLADYHINQIPWFSLQEWFMIAWEALVFCAFILAFKDSRPSMFELLNDSMNDFAKSIEKHNEKVREDLEKENLWGKTKEEILNETQYWPTIKIEVKKNEIPEWLRVPKKTTKGIPLSDEHKKKISDSLKKMNAEKKAQKARIDRTAAASKKRKATK